MFGSLFSDRYNKKREMFYANYEETRQRFPNLPLYRRAREPLSSKCLKRGRKKLKAVDYDYDGWIAGNFVSIVVRRSIESWTCRQLMDSAPSSCVDACSWRSWPHAGETKDEGEPRRSARLTYRYRPTLKLKDIASSKQLGTNNFKLQQRLPAKNSMPKSWTSFDCKIKHESLAKIEEEQQSQDDEDTEEQQQHDKEEGDVDQQQFKNLATFINGCHNNSTLQCNMCGSYFGKSSDFELHSLDDCRKYLLATLRN